MKPGDEVEVRVTYLEMLEPPVDALPPAPPGTEVRQLVPVTASSYRRLYDGVGRDYYWVDRHAIPDAELEAMLNEPGIEVHVLYVDGREAGYAELDRRTDGEVRLMYFGLMPSFVGRGLGRWLLRWAIDAAWASRPRRIWVDTCTMDHPRALPNYERAGFRKYDVKTRSFVIPAG